MENINATVSVTLKELDELRKKLEDTTKERDELKKSEKMITLKLSGSVTDRSRLITKPNHYYRSGFSDPNSYLISGYDNIRVDEIQKVNLEDIVETLRSEETAKVESKITQLTGELQRKEDKYNEFYRNSNEDYGKLKKDYDEKLSVINFENENKVKLLLDNIAEFENKKKEDSIVIETEELKNRLSMLQGKYNYLQNRSFWERVFNRQ
jgi:hypothetical protein